MANLNENHFYDLEQLKRDSELLAVNLERVQDMYKRMSSVLAKHIEDDQSMNDIIGVNKNLRKMKRIMADFLIHMDRCIELEKRFPWE